MKPSRSHSCWFSVFFSHVHSSNSSPPLARALDSLSWSWTMEEVQQVLFCSVSVYYLQMNVFLRNVDKNVVDVCGPSGDDCGDEDGCVPYCWYRSNWGSSLTIAVDSRRSGRLSTIVQQVSAVSSLTIRNNDDHSVLSVVVEVPPYF